MIRKFVAAVGAALVLAGVSAAAAVPEPVAPQTTDAYTKKHLGNVKYNDFALGYQREPGKIDFPNL